MGKFSPEKKVRGMRDFCLTMNPFSDHCGVERHKECGENETELDAGYMREYITILYTSFGQIRKGKSFRLADKNEFLMIE